MRRHKPLAMAPSQLSPEDCAELTRLEEAMWKADTRFDLEFQEARFAPDFVEFGRSGKIYQRSEIIREGGASIEATLPLPNLAMKALDANTVQVTYDSAVVYRGVTEHAHRSSIWSRAPSGWVMGFHQGTPFYPQLGGPPPGNASAA